MPKRVDHDERRRTIAEALWRIASTRGLESASLRDVAAEAGMSLGQLQHYFRSRGEMLVFALEHINQYAGARVRKRITAAGDAPGPRTVLGEIVAELLPMDDNSRNGIMVQLAYFILAVHDERMRHYAKEGTPALVSLLAEQIRLGIERGEVATDRDPGAEAILLLSLTDGLGNYVLLDVFTPAEAMRLATAHLDRLFTP
ncbi:TetR family transcriptional regulator C-terminal domain-containing protein [Streptomyces sp. SCA3-4]|uniref:TetR/AcrR family transcriptional regulator n=1 Tax=Streptomyces sichuanensis TaxID=2871810 RepID=UPI001CE2BAFA|nr:TetR family transcriptional regulator C-terminal domain-containing protein [Streptomyces sichuanensis]MCA6094376.1 TetR family transcriptional regulator C-terminal domain-containing protein [Streptomyces sichuanensis]